MPLTAKAVSAPNLSGKRERRSDGQGLSLLVNPTGSARWELQYSFGGKRRSIGLGDYPAITLAAARAAAAAARVELEAGRDPGTPIEPDEPPAGPPFGPIAREWYAHHSTGWSRKYRDVVRVRIEQDILPVLGALPVDRIGHADIAAALKKIEARGAAVVAQRVRAYIEKIFAWHFRAEPGRPNPAANAAAELKPRPRSAVKRRAFIRESALPQFFAALRAYHGEPITPLALEFIIRTAVRTAEMRFATWDEIEPDLWRIPDARMKMGLEHLVPLAPGALAILKAAKARGGGSNLIFPGEGGRPMSENTCLFALYRMGYRSRATTHGFRSTFSTAANESGLFHPDWIEMQLAHSEADSVRAAYNSATYLAQRREMMAWWDRRVSEAKAAGALL